MEASGKSRLKPVEVCAERLGSSRKCVGINRHIWKLLEASTSTNSRRFHLLLPWQLTPPSMKEDEVTLP